MKHPLDALVSEFASFMDMVKVDFTARGLWTEYDQGLRDRITAYNLEKMRLAGTVGDPRHSMREAQRPDVKAAAEAEGLHFVLRSHGLATTTTVSLDTLTNIVHASGVLVWDEAQQRAEFEAAMRKASSGEPDWKSPTALWAWEAWQIARRTAGVGGASK